ncbi:MAG: response regulator [Deltaproteobacteria bacterium]|nr:response regulator [Deltaproteobacteria bacterium]
MESILFVDDEPKIWQGIKRALHGEPYEMIGVTSGKEALEILEEREIDIIISDEMMPIMTGNELLKICKEKYPEMIRIMLTGKGNLNTAMNAIYDGWIFHYIEKPVKAQNLASVIHVALLIRSLRSDDESKHLVMSLEQQIALLEKYGIEHSLNPQNATEDYESLDDLVE